MERDYLGEYTYLRDISDDENIPLEVRVFYMVMKIMNGLSNVGSHTIHFQGDNGYEHFCNNFPEIVPYLVESKEVE